MWYFWGVRLFKGELLAVKVQSFFNFFQQQNTVLQKKDTATILIFQWGYPGYGLVFENFE